MSLLLILCYATVCCTFIFGRQHLAVALQNAPHVALSLLAPGLEVAAELDSNVND